jgi:hypothetical protein
VAMMETQDSCQRERHAGGEGEDGHERKLWG